MNAISHRLSAPAMIVACLSLLVALGGVSYAAGMLPKNSVGTAQLQKKAVTGPKINKNAVTGVKVKDGTLLAADFKAGQLPAGPQGPKGDTGAQGAPGPQGPKGDKGNAGATNVTKRSAVGPSAGAGGYSNAAASCQAGETLVGGGAVTNSPPPAVPALISSAPDPNSASSWSAVYRNDGVGLLTAFAYALCASP